MLQIKCSTKELFEWHENFRKVQQYRLLDTQSTDAVIRPSEHNASCSLCKIQILPERSHETDMIRISLSWCRVITLRHWVEKQPCGESLFAYSSGNTQWNKLCCWLSCPQSGVSSHGFGSVHTCTGYFFKCCVSACFWPFIQAALRRFGKLPRGWRLQRPPDQCISETSPNEL